MELDRLVVVLDGAAVVALALAGNAAAPIGDGIFRPELDRPVEVLDGAAVVALALVGGAAADVGDGIFRSSWIAWS